MKTYNALSKPFTDELISDLYDRLFSVDYFDDIEIKAAKNSDNGKTVNLFIVVQEKPVVDKVQLDLQDVLSSGEQNERFSISHLREEKLLSKLGADPDLSAVFDSIIKDKEHEIANLSQEVTALRKQLHEEKTKADALQSSYSKSESDGQEGMFEITEVPKYDHEIEDIILRVLDTL